MLRNTSPIICVTLAAVTAACSNSPATPSVVRAADSAAPARITVKNFGFDPADLTVAPGTEVEWTDQGGKHTVQADDGSFKSEIMTEGGTFKHRFARPGVYRYFCQFHGSKGGHDMAGVVNVR